MSACAERCRDLFAVCRLGATAIDNDTARVSGPDTSIGTAHNTFVRVGEGWTLDPQGRNLRGLRPGRVLSCAVSKVIAAMVALTNLATGAAQAQSVNIDPTTTPGGSLTIPPGTLPPPATSNSITGIVCCRP
jgi:hypothetical protein